MKKDTFTEEKAENSKTGGVLVGKRKGQTIIHNKGTLSGYLVGKTHAEGGIKAINKSTGQPLEMQGGEVVITAPAVADQTKHEFDGEMLTNREILSKINERGGGVSFAKGGDIPSKMYYNGGSYNYGGQTMTDYEIMQKMNNYYKKNEYKKGGVVTYKDKYNRKYKYPKGTSHTLEEISKDTGVSMKGLQQIYNKGIGAYKTNPESVRPNVKSKEQWAMARVYSAVMGGKASKVDSNELKMNTGGHLAKGMTLKQIADKHNVTLSKLNHQVKLGLKAESEHTSSKREQMQIVKDHLFENPNYYTLLKKVGLKNGGAVGKENLVKDAKSGNNPARDLNNYNDVLDLEADGVVGGLTGLELSDGVGGADASGGVGAFAKGGSLDFLDDVDKLFAKGGLVNTRIDNWSEIPEEYLSVPKLSKVNLDGLNKKLYNFLKPYFYKEASRPALQGINIDEFGITATNTHILFHIETPELKKGVYIPEKSGDEINFVFREDLQFPNYTNIVPKKSDIKTTYQVDLSTLYTYLKVLDNIFGKSLHQVNFEINKDQIAFDLQYMLEFVSSFIKLGIKDIVYVSFDSNKRALVFSFDKEYQLGKTFGLIMPLIYAPLDYLGAFNQETETYTNFYYSFDNNSIRNANGNPVLILEQPKKPRAKRTPKVKATEKSESKKLDLSDKFIRINGDENLAKKVIKRAEELGKTDNGAVLRKIERGETILNIVFGQGIYVGWINDDMSEYSYYQEISLYDLFGEEMPESTSVEPKPTSEKNNFELERKFLTSRINDLSLELNVKKLVLSREEISFYQRDINKFIQLLRDVNEKEESSKLVSERFDSIFSVKFGDFEKQYPSADLNSINGLKTELTEKEYLDVRTPEFKAFFGDWQNAYLTGDYESVSKVINEKTKEPMPVYHGTNVLFTNWKTYETNNAHYFAVRRDFSDFFATTWEERVDKSALDSKTIKNLNPNKGVFMYRCFIDVKNPIDFSKFGVDKYPVSDFLTYLKINYNIGDYDFWTNLDFKSGVDKSTMVYAWQIIRLWQSFTQYVKLFTMHDGYIFYEFLPESQQRGLEDASLCYCAFDSNQIKFNDAYEFNALSNDSRFDFGGKL